MADSSFDNNNKGAAWTPFPTQEMILQGKVTIDFEEHKVVLVKDVLRDGKKVIEVYGKLGVMFDNDKNGNDAAPDFSGPMGDKLRIAGWKRMKDGAPFISMSVSEKQVKGNAPQKTGGFDDSIPF